MQTCPYCEKPISIQSGVNPGKSWAILACLHCQETVVILDPVPSANETRPLQKAVRTYSTAHDQKVEHAAFAPISLELRSVTEDEIAPEPAVASPAPVQSAPEVKPVPNTALLKNYPPYTKRRFTMPRVILSASSALLLTAVLLPYLRNAKSPDRNPAPLFEEHAPTQIQAMAKQETARIESSEALLDRSEDPTLKAVPEKLEPTQTLAAVIAPSAVVRSGPGTQFSKETILTKGTSIQVIEEKQGWFQIAMPSTASADRPGVGWIRKDLVGKTE